MYGLAPKKNGDFAWIMHMYSSMREDTGRMAVVVPHGVLFRGGSEAKIRKALIRSGSLNCVIGLAENLFYGTTISACILIFSKEKRTLNRKEVLFINAEEIYNKCRAQNTLSEIQVDEIFQIYKHLHYSPEFIDDISRWVSIQEIEENDFNLNIARYLQKPLEEETITIKQALRDLQNNFSDLEKAEEKLYLQLSNEGFIE